jgi:CspA family cold shock protein
MAMQGTVKVYKDDKAYGFIKQEDGGPDLFFHITRVKGHRKPGEGTLVSYEVGEDKKNNKPQAINVQLLD